MNTREFYIPFLPSREMKLPRRSWGWRSANNQKGR